MRTAALPGFRKLYRLVNHSAQGYADGLPRGEYSLIVEYCKLWAILKVLYDCLLLFCV